MVMSGSLLVMLSDIFWGGGGRSKREAVDPSDSLGNTGVARRKNVPAESTKLDRPEIQRLGLEYLS